jgi:hypothetical protein
LQQALKSAAISESRPIILASPGAAPRVSPYQVLCPVGIPEIPRHLGKNTLPFAPAGRFDTDLGRDHRNDADGLRLRCKPTWIEAVGRPGGAAPGDRHLDRVPPLVVARWSDYNGPPMTLGAAAAARVRLIVVTFPDLPVGCRITISIEDERAAGAKCSGQP